MVLIAVYMSHSIERISISNAMNESLLWKNIMRKTPTPGREKLYGWY